ncbi:MAG TPA: hypothetical protein VNJ05_10025 [Sphingomicrobium sp.]|nr:hypothetical protein [Sphingomicrobium sp.]
MKWACALAAAALVAACSKAPTVIDGSSPQTFAETTEQARRDLPIKDRLTFDAALKNPSALRYSERDLEAVARESYHGMTAFDVVADARARGIE